MRHNRAVTQQEEHVHFNSGDLRLEGMIHRAEQPRLAGVVLHPHPLYGGDMDNHVVTTICDAMCGLGATTLRFNFRGAGASEGTHENSRRERDDAAAAVELVREAAPGAPHVLAGYSFGAMIAASVAAEVRADALVLVSPPVAVTHVPELPADVRALLVTGAEDQVAPHAGVQLLETASHTVAVVGGADHSWWGRTRELSDALCRFLTSNALTH